MQVHDVPLVGIMLSNGSCEDVVHCVLRLHPAKQRKTTGKTNGQVLGTTPVFTATKLANFDPEISAAAKKLIAAKPKEQQLLGYMVMITHQTSAGEKIERTAVVSTKQVCGCCITFSLDGCTVQSGQHVLVHVFNSYQQLCSPCPTKTPTNTLPTCMLLYAALQRTSKAFKEAVSLQTGIPGLFSALKDDDVEALYADDTGVMNSTSVMYIASYVGKVEVPASVAGDKPT